MKITSEQQARLTENESQLKKLNQTIEKKIRAREEELNKINELYDKKEDMALLEGEEQYARALDRNAQRVVGASKDFENKIEAYRARLADTQQLVQREEHNLKTTEAQKLEGIKKNLAANFEDKYQSALSEQQAIEFNTQTAIGEIAANAKNEKDKIERHAQFEISTLASGFDQKIKNNESTFRARLENEQKKQKMLAEREQQELKDNLLEETTRMKRMGDEKNRIQHDQLLFSDKHHQNIIKQKTDDFRFRYEKIVKEHDTIIKELESQLALDMKKMVEKSATDKALYAKRLDDRFYQVEKLNPVVTELPEAVEVSIELPEHEKENFHLSAQGRNIKMTLSRKYANSITAPDGSVDKSTRSELFSKEVGVKDILNSNKITQRYDQGVLTYRILKA